MCGLLGFWRFAESVEFSRNDLFDMLDRQRHRGPDDQGAVAINTPDNTIINLSDSENKAADNFDLFLGFNRLSILDLSANGHQPMIDNNVVLMLNGEIYNAFDLRPDLEKKGYTFKSNTDTEVVLKAYQEYGLNGMLAKLNGMFGLAIYDLNKKELYLIRDRYGIKPLYVTLGNKYISFSSEMKSFKGIPNFSYELNQENWSELFLFRNLINRTLFKSTFNLEPGTILTINGNGELNESKFYDLEYEGTCCVSNTDLKGFLQHQLKAAVKRQLLSDVKLGCQLSGGIDSSLVTAYAKEFSSENLMETISIIPNVEGFSEEVYIDQVVEKTGVKANKYVLNDDYYIENLLKVAYSFEQPLNHPNTVGINLLSENAKKHVTVLLSGEGADEVLGGYDRFISGREGFMSRSSLGIIKRNRQIGVSKILKLLTKEKRMVLASAHTAIGSINSVLNNFEIERALSFRLELLSKFSGDEFLKQRKYEIATYLPDLLMRQDKMSMNSSIENRVPFLDNEFVSNSLNLNENQLLYSGKDKPSPKRLLKEIAAQEFDNNFAYRKKQGFPIPLKKFFSTRAFDKLWHEVVLHGVSEDYGFDKRKINELYKNRSKLNSFDLDQLWMITSFGLFHNQYLG